MFTDREEFYMNGFKEIHIDTTKPAFLKIMHHLQEVVNDRQKEGFTWETKYRGTEDLRPNVYGYDECFMQFLIENDMQGLLKQLTGYHYELYHIQVRRVSAHSNMRHGNNTVSYMDWHRDAYIRGDTVLGKFPPLIKVMFYPTLGRESRDRFKMISNSHTVQMHTDQDYVSTFGAPINSLDRQLISACKHSIIRSSDEKITVFNTALLHGAVPNAGDDRALRVVYIFALEDQFDDPGIHEDTRDAFRKAQQDTQ